MACALGCSEGLSAAATAAATYSGSKPGRGWKSVSTALPSVRVPVLSIATTCTSASRCRAWPRRNRMPSSAPRPVATRIETGVARPMAQGQAMISTAIALTTARSSRLPISHQPAKASSASSITAGTNQRVTWSTLAWIGSLPPWACSTRVMIRARVVSPATACTCTASAPVVLMVPALTASPGRLSTGSGSPLSMDSSTALCPSTTTPSAAMRSPGRSSRMSAACSAATATVCSLPSARRTRACSGCSLTKRAMAAELCPRARASSQRPASTRVTITAADSKYTWTLPAGNATGASRATSE